MDSDQRPRTFRLPDLHYRGLSLLVAVNGFPTRADAIRYAIEETAKREAPDQWRELEERIKHEGVKP